jgi:hypothetical protein
MRPIRLPEPPGDGMMETPEIFAGGATGATVVRRAVLIGNGSPGAENQCLGLARALGLADNLTLYVSSPTIFRISYRITATVRQEWKRCLDCLCSTDAELSVSFRLLISLPGLDLCSASRGPAEGSTSGCTSSPFPCTSS